MSDTIETLLENALEAIANLRNDGRHLHSITNTVAQNFTANVLLAAGASVSMTTNPDEIRAFIQNADAVHINLGTLSPEREKAIEIAIAEASNRDLPRLLDPVMVHTSPLRLELARNLIGSATIIKTNQSEAKALGLSGDRLCLVETGSVDTIQYSGTKIQIENGSPLMAKVIATGCALGALIAILEAKAKNPTVASLAGLLWFSIAGEKAAEKANGPGSFVPAFLDELASIQLEEIKERAKVR